MLIFSNRVDPDIAIDLETLHMVSDPRHHHHTTTSALSDRLEYLQLRLYDELFSPMSQRLVKITIGVFCG